MKKQNSLFALILASLLTVSVFTSCEPKDDPENPDGTEQGGGTETGSTEDTPKLKLPEGKPLEGETFSMYLALSTVKNSYIAEEETGDTLVDAVLERNSLVEERLGVDLDFVCTTLTSSGADQNTETSNIRTLIQAGDDTYDAFVHVQHTGMPTLIEEEMFVDWNEIPYINLDNPWWYSNIKRDICFGDKVYLMTGDYNYTTFSNCECLLFNKEMCDELGLAYPYSMVYDGTWTHEKFVEYIRAAKKDINGDGAMTRADDRFGFGGWEYEQLPALFAAYGGEVLVKDDNNLPVLNIDNEITYTIVDKMLEVFSDDSAFYEGKTGADYQNPFKEGRLLFMDGFLLHAAAFRNLDLDYGFVPYPKMNEEQEDYYTRCANVGGFTYIPVTNTNLEKTGMVLEAMAYYSEETVMPAYFDIILTVKSTRDVESEDMIPIIRNSARFLDANIGWTPSSIVKANNGNTLASAIASSKDAWEEKIEALTELYTK